MQRLEYLKIRPHTLFGSFQTGVNRRLLRFKELDRMLGCGSADSIRPCHSQFYYDVIIVGTR